VSPAPGAAACRPTLAAVPGLIPSAPQHCQRNEPQREVFEAKRPHPSLVPRCGRGCSQSRVPSSELAAHHRVPPSPGALALGQPRDPKAGGLLTGAAGGRCRGRGGSESPPGPLPVTTTQQSSSDRGCPWAVRRCQSREDGWASAGAALTPCPFPSPAQAVGKRSQGVPTPHS